MAFSLQLPTNDKKLLTMLLLVYLLTRLPFLTFLPFIQDESLYSVMSYEQIQNPTSFVPTYLGEQVCWKPAPFFRLHSYLANLNLPLEVRYRLPSFLAGLLTIIPLYFVLLKLSESKNIAFFSVLLFLISGISIYTNDAVLTDSLAFLLITLSLFFYLHENIGRFKLRSARFLLAGLFAAAAVFAKISLAILVLPLAIAYLYLNDRKALINPIFLFSLLFVPTALLLIYYEFESAFDGPMLKVLFAGPNLMNDINPLNSQVRTFIDSLSSILSGAGIWFMLAIPGFLKFWRKNLVLSLWFLLAFFPLLSASAMPWYFLPVLPAICFFAVLTLTQWEGKETLDAFFVIILSIMLILSLALTVITDIGLSGVFSQQKSVGLYLAGKENVLIVGGYAPGIVAYKTLTEAELLGRPLDFGWVLASNMTDDFANDYVMDYYSDEHPIIDGSFSSMFATASVYRKATNLTHFDYVVLVYQGLNYTLPGNASLVYNTSRINVYHVSPQMVSSTG